MVRAEFCYACSESHCIHRYNIRIQHQPRHFCRYFTVGVCCFLFLFYGPWAGFRNFWITSAMTTMTHQYLATWFYSDETIQEVLQSNSIIESGDISNPDAIQFRQYTTTIYRNEYEKAVLQKDGLRAVCS